ncbi:unnamed protein product [Malassezia sympodialis ATCC 42132]|mgnify:CR=1 FL=1|nr:uncharacterized protein MSY001_1581 [Malassezia sympodialis ATCC 42132]CCU98875.1 unnamed protein product [Malassezia sympodialis ATCC 42132]|eukprot:XP_018740156.1 uncharacterized protein MSY001_1581 [Malassezia sympodialis ATCC 42132]
MDPIGHWTNRQIGKLGLEAFYPTPLEQEIDKAARIVRTFTHRKEDAAANVEVRPSDVVDENASKKTQPMLAKIPPEVLRAAKGVAVFTVFRSGFIFSGAGGSGVVLTKDESGEWGPPSGLLVHTVGWGLMAGVDVYDVVLVLRNQRAVDAFKYPKISVGGELTVSAGPVGNGAMVDSGVEASPCFSYVKSKGLYAGVQLDGTIILTRSDENARFYNYPDISVETLLDVKIPRHQMPRECMPLWQALCAGEGRPEHLGTDAIPSAPAPGDHTFTDEEIDALRQDQEKLGGAPGPGAQPAPAPVGEAKGSAAPPAADILPPPQRRI